MNFVLTPYRIVDIPQTARRCNQPAYFLEIDSASALQTQLLNSSEGTNIQAVGRKHCTVMSYQLSSAKMEIWVYYYQDLFSSLPRREVFY